MKANALTIDHPTAVRVNSKSFLLFYFLKITISEFSQFSLCKVFIKVVCTGGRVSFLYRHGYRLVLMPQGMTHASMYMDKSNWTQWVKKGGRKERRQERRGGGEERSKTRGEEERKGAERI